MYHLGVFKYRGPKEAEGLLRITYALYGRNYDEPWIWLLALLHYICS